MDPAGRLREEFLRRLLAARSVSAAAQAAVDTVRSLLDVDISWCGTTTDGALTMAAHSGLRTTRMAATWRLPLGQGIGGRVAVDGRPLAVRDYRHDPRRAPVMKTLIDEEGMRGALCAPLVDGADVLGVLYAADRRAHDWTPHEFDTVVAIARDAGSVIRHIEQTASTGRRADDDRRLFEEAQQGLAVSGEIARALARPEGLDAGLAVLAHHLGRYVEVVGDAGELALGRAGAGAEHPVRFDVDLGAGVAGRLRVRGDRDLEPTERALVTATSAVVALQVLGERAAVRSELRIVAEFLDDLLAGRTDDRRGLRARAALLGIDLDEPHHVVRLGAHKPEHADEVPVLDRDTVHHVEQAVRTRYPRSLVVPQGGDVVLLLRPSADGVREVCSSLEHAIRARPGAPVGLAAGLGRLCSTVGDYVDSAAEAGLALDLARRRRAVGRVLTPRDLGLYGLLVRGSTRQIMQSMVERALGTLLTADADGGPDLVKTLRTYLTNDRHLERTAAALHVHPNTVRYRVNRAQELLEVNLRDPDERFLLELALRVQSALEEG